MLFLFIKFPRSIDLGTEYSGTFGVERGFNFRLLQCGIHHKCFQLQVQQDLKNRNETLVTNVSLKYRTKKPPGTFIASIIARLKNRNETLVINVSLKYKTNEKKSRYLVASIIPRPKK